MRSAVRARSPGATSRELREPKLSAAAEGSPLEKDDVDREASTSPRFETKRGAKEISFAPPWLLLVREPFRCRTFRSACAQSRLEADVDVVVVVRHRERRSTHADQGDDLSRLELGRQEQEVADCTLRDTARLLVPGD
jgi:hypothetical protein